MLHLLSALSSSPPRLFPLLSEMYAQTTKHNEILLVCITDLDEEIHLNKYVPCIYLASLDFLSFDFSVAAVCFVLASWLSATDKYVRYWLSQEVW